MRCNFIEHAFMHSFCNLLHGCFIVCCFFFCFVLFLFFFLVCFFYSCLSKKNPTGFMLCYMFVHIRQKLKFLSMSLV